MGKLLIETPFDTLLVAKMSLPSCRRFGLKPVTAERRRTRSRFRRDRSTWSFARRWSRFPASWGRVPDRLSARRAHRGHRRRSCAWRGRRAPAAAQCTRTDALQAPTRPLCRVGRMWAGSPAAVRTTRAPPRSRRLEFPRTGRDSWQESFFLLLFLFAACRVETGYHKSIRKNFSNRALLQTKSSRFTWLPYQQFYFLSP